MCSEVGHELQGDDGVVHVDEIQPPGDAGAVRAHVKGTFGCSLTQYRDFFQGLFGPADPVLYPGRYNPDKILMIDALFDDCMPESSRAALWESTGHPERITLLYRHRRAFYSMTPLGLHYSQRKIYQL